MRYAFAFAAIIIMGCSGPIPLDHAIQPQHEHEYAALHQYAGNDLREAWYAQKAAEASKPIKQIRAADEAMSTTRNPFNAKSDPDAVSRGAVIFRDLCVRCHGEDCRGKGLSSLPSHPASDFHTFGMRFAVTVHGGAPRTWFRKINEGFGETVAYPEGPSRAMPAFGEQLSREQIWLVITYLQSLDAYAAHPDSSIPTTK